MSGDFRKYGAALEELYEKLNRREYVSPDPLQFLYDYPDLRDREIVGVIASSIAFGNVKAIVSSARKAIFSISKPYEVVANSNAEELERVLKGFKHRVFSPSDFAVFLAGVGAAAKKHGSIEACFRCHYREYHNTLMETAVAVVHEVEESARLSSGTQSFNPTSSRGFKWLLSSTSPSGAMKKWNLFLRWMVRSDAVDPGGWNGFPKSKLVIPLDTHMLRIAQHLGLTNRAAANRACALEVTEAFRSISPDDPVKYDFALTRLGIRDDCDMDAFFRNCGVDAASSSAKRGG
jgi:uncharacterized protein (TIGR02757 family)